MGAEDLQIKKKFNLYDYALALMVALQIFGGYGGALQPVRIYIILLVPFALIYLSRKHLFGYYGYQSRYFMIFLVYAIVAGLFVRDQLAAAKEMSYLIVNFSAFFVMIFLARKAQNPKLSLINGWVLLFLLTIPIAFVEILLDYHLPISVLQSDEVVGGIGEARRSASITFGNYNAYNVVLVYAFPFLMAMLLIRKKFITQLFLWTIVLILFFIVVTNASRGSLVCISVIFAIFLGYYIKTNIKGRYTFIIALTATVAFLVIKYADVMFTVISYRFSEFGVEDNTRSQLIYDSITLFFNSFCLGVGTGNFQSAMAHYYNLPIIAPHNFFLEIAVQYGIVVFVGFIIMLVKIYLKARTETIRPYRFIVFSAMLVYPVASIINSGYIEGITVWMQLGSLFIMADPGFSLLRNKTNG